MDIVRGMFTYLIHTLYIFAPIRIYLFLIVLLDSSFIVMLLQAKYAERTPLDLISDLNAGLASVEVMEQGTNRIEGYAYPRNYKMIPSVHLCRVHIPLHLNLPFQPLHFKV